MGDRRENIERAIRSISEIFGDVFRTEMVGSEPWGFDSTNLFMNAGVAFSSALSPERVLSILQGIERELSETPHRNRDGSYRDREIDIDIMTVWERDKGEIKMNTPTLILPHPHLQAREFFLQPLRELYHLFPPIPILEAP